MDIAEEVQKVIEEQMQQLQARALVDDLEEVPIGLYLGAMHASYAKAFVMIAARLDGLCNYVAANLPEARDVGEGDAG